MKKRILSYRQKVDALLAHPDTISPDRWSDILQEHLIQIGFFQHERLVHLIVTVTFAILTLISIVAALMICNPALYVLTLLLVHILCIITRWKTKCRRCMDSMTEFWNI